MKRLVHCVALCATWMMVAIPDLGAAQGCSDAGFCSLGNLKAQSFDSKEGNGQRLSLFLPYGVGDDDVQVFTPSVEYSNRFSRHWCVEAKLSGNYAAGMLGNASGPGDLFISGIYAVKSKSKWAASIMLAAKLPLNSSNLTSSRLPLPMQYQSSLGTFDIVNGILLRNDHWQFTAGYQQPISGKNNNQFLPLYWSTPEAENYPASKSLLRKGDVLLKSAYTMWPGKKLSAQAGLLGIYHLGEDEFTDEHNAPVSISGSKGITLNATLGGWWSLSDSIIIGFTAGTPLIVRDVRPDGLTRAFIIAPEITWKF